MNHTLKRNKSLLVLEPLINVKPAIVGSLHDYCTVVITIVGAHGSLLVWIGSRMAFLAWFWLVPSTTQPKVGCTTFSRSMEAALGSTTWTGWNHRFLLWRLLNFGHFARTHGEPNDVHLTCHLCYKGWNSYFSNNVHPDLFPLGPGVQPWAPNGLQSK